jgi:Zn-dependent M28 family amino/carboxypeptidase
MTTLAVVAFILATLLYLLSVFIDVGMLRWLVLILIPVYLIVLALTWQPDTTPYTQGANDNGSGASIVLSLSEQLAHSPLKNIEVWTLCPGCEEVGSHGVQAFVKQHQSELPGLVAINIDNVGGKGAGVCYASVEGMVVPYKAAPELIGLAEKIKAERPDFNAYMKPFTAMHTDAMCFMVNKVPTLSFIGLRPDGVIPNWHQVTDTFDQVDATVVEQTEEFVLELLRRLDAE